MTRVWPIKGSLCFVWGHPFARRKIKNDYAIILSSIGLFHLNVCRILIICLHCIFHYVKTEQTLFALTLMIFHSIFEIRFILALTKTTMTNCQSILCCQNGSKLDTIQDWSVSNAACHNWIHYSIEENNLQITVHMPSLNEFWFAQHKLF